MKNNTTLTYRVGQLERCNEKTEKKLDKILTNHLPHINEEIVALKTRVTVAALFNVGAVIFAVVASKLL